MDKKLRSELLAMMEEDQRVREELVRDGSLWEAYHPRMEAVHQKNAASLTEILDARGWPGQSDVGEDGAYAAWMIVQHAIGNPPLQRRALRLLQAAANEDEADPKHAAMLEDRIRMYEGRKQLYGTQFNWNERGEMTLVPIDDPEHVDERRVALGFAPIANAEVANREFARQRHQNRPNDFDRFWREYQDWLKRVGWRE
jgi:uncharacterized protein DUF6624